MVDNLELTVEQIAGIIRDWQGPYFTGDEINNDQRNAAKAIYQAIQPIVEENKRLQRDLNIYQLGCEEAEKEITSLKLTIAGRDKQIAGFQTMIANRDKDVLITVPPPEVKGTT